jgi:hypothetical protein
VVVVLSNNEASVKERGDIVAGLAKMNLETSLDIFVLSHVVSMLGSILVSDNKEEITASMLLEWANDFFNTLPPDQQELASASIEIISTKWKSLLEESA